GNCDAPWIAHESGAHDRGWSQAPVQLVVRRGRGDVRQRGVLVLRLGEVAERDHTDRLSVVDYRQPAYVRLLHLLDRVVDRGVRAQRLEVGRRGLTHACVRTVPLGDHADDDVAVGDDALHLAVLDHEHVADVALVHQLCRLFDGGARLYGRRL